MPAEFEVWGFCLRAAFTCSRRLMSSALSFNEISPTDLLNHSQLAYLNYLNLQELEAIGLSIVMVAALTLALSP